MSLINLLDLKVYGDARGRLGVLEGERSVPFGIKRVYYLIDTKKDEPRGFHAHKTLEQIAVSVVGKCRMVLDDGHSKCEEWLDTPTKAIQINRMVWHEMHDFSADCVLLVLASDYYDEADYIRNYAAFLAMVKND